MFALRIYAALLTFLAVSNIYAAPNGIHFNRAIFVLFENTNYADAIREPFFKQLADTGANFTNMLALTHPSQGNYIALTSGSLNGVTSDKNFDIDSENIIDLLEAKGLSWTVYAEEFPGNCFTGAKSGLYARKHNPFISYLNIQKNPGRCAHIVNAADFDKDAQSGNLPNYVFYVPNNKNNGHDTGVQYAAKWYSQKFSSFINDSQFMSDTILISTFDESGRSSKNQIYTSIVGAGIKAGSVSKEVTLYSLLKLVEDNWDLGGLGKDDSQAIPIPDIWK